MAAMKPKRKKIRPEAAAARARLLELIEPRVKVVKAPFTAKKLALIKEIFSGDSTFEGLHGRPLEKHCRSILGIEAKASMEAINEVINEQIPGAAPRLLLQRLQSMTSKEVINDEVFKKQVRLCRKKPKTEKWYAAKILNQLFLLRKSIERGRDDEAILRAFELGALEMAGDLKVLWLPAAEHGITFLTAGSLPRKPGALTLKLEETIEKVRGQLSREPRPADVIKALRREDTKKIDSKTICWSYQGLDYETAIQTIRNRLPDLLKQNPLTRK